MEKESKPRFKPYEVFTKLMSLGKSMRTHCHRAIEADGFTLNETDVLLALTASPENNTVGAISESSNISKGNISQAVESLKQKGYLVTEQSSDDRRYVAVRLTEAADPVIEKLKAAEDEYFAGFMGALPSTEEASLVTRIFDAVQRFSPTAFLGKLSGKGKNADKNAADKKPNVFIHRSPISSTWSPSLRAAASAPCLTILTLMVTSGRSPTARWRRV